MKEKVEQYTFQRILREGSIFIFNTRDVQVEKNKPGGQMDRCQKGWSQLEGEVRLNSKEALQVS